MESVRKKSKISEFLEQNEKAREEFEKTAKEIREAEKNKTNYKEQCRFYDRERKKCMALKDVYCDKEDKICAFFKKGVRENEE